MSLAKKIRERRKALELHQYELAAKLGVSQSTVADWENGVQSPRSGRLKKIAKVLHVPLADLLG